MIFFSVFQQAPVPIKNNKTIVPDYLFNKQSLFLQPVTYNEIIIGFNELPNFSALSYDERNPNMIKQNE